MGRLTAILRHGARRARSAHDAPFRRPRLWPRSTTGGGDSDGGLRPCLRRALPAFRRTAWLLRARRLLWRGIVLHPQWIFDRPNSAPHGPRFHSRGERRVLLCPPLVPDLAALLSFPDRERHL